MVLTRSQDEENQRRVFDQPPRSPSSTPTVRGRLETGNAGESLRTAPQVSQLALTTSRAGADIAGARVALAVTTQPPSGADERAAHPMDTAATTSAMTSSVQPARRVHVARSTRSTASNAARRKLRIEAEERLAAIRRRELELEADLVRKTLNIELDTLDDAESEPEVVEPAEKLHDRVFEWLDDTNVGRQRGELACNNAAADRPRESEPRRDREERRRSSSRGRGIDQLASVLESLVRARPPPRQASDLPIFSGSPLDWLQFVTAMKETTRLYQFSPTENIARLRNCLRGAARESVATLLSTATHPDEIMSTLAQCYGRPETLVDLAYAEMKKLPKIGPTANDLNMFAVKLQNAVAILKTVKSGYLHNPLLTREVLDKVPLHLKRGWYEYAESQPGPDADLLKLTSYIMKEADLAMRYDYVPSFAVPAPQRTPREATRSAPRTEAKKKTVYVATEEAPRRCPTCNDAHTLPSCPKFKRLSYDERWEVVKKEGLCFKCVTGRHRRLNCRQKHCGINGCKRPHHRLLHAEESKESAHEATNATERDTDANEPATTETTTATTTTRRAVKLKICPVTITGKRGSCETYALFDEGSTITLMDDDLAQQIGADGPTTQLNVRGINKEQRHVKSRRININIRGTHSSEDFNINARTLAGLDLTPQSIPAEVLKFEHLRGLNEQEVVYKNVKPRILIGTDNWELIVTRELRSRRASEPAASRTQLGWVIHGTAPTRALRRTDNVLHIIAAGTPDEQLEELVSRHFQVDSLGVSLDSAYVREDDKRAVTIFERTVTHKEGKYEVGLPWRSNEVELPRSYDSALRRLTNIENKLKRDPRDMEEYQRRIDNLVSKGYAEPCDGSEDSSPVAWYLPHFAVKNPNKPGKLRLVFDAAAKTRGVSLNDHLLEGPDLLRSLQTILFRFREGTHAVTADIEEMFLRVKIRKEDQPAQMFLWRDCQQDKPPRKMKMTSMIFGASSSPFLAHSVRNYNARKHAETHPAALRAITEAHYMDDFVDSFDDLKEACKVIKQVDAVHKSAGFHLRGWNSNSEELLQTVNPDSRAKNGTTSLGETEKTLGLLWDANTDRLGFNTTLPRVPPPVKSRQRPPTKREALSTVMSIYDPLGLLSCFTITAKIVLQKLWRLKTGWDDPLPSDLGDEFDAWIASLPTIGQLRLPRSYNGGRTVRRRELHVFCDASEEAYATVAYWRLVYGPDHAVETVLVAARAKVAPLKTQTIPRLELQAALIGTRLAKAIRDEHRVNINDTVFWSDSQTVLHWLRNGSRRYTPFVAHRLGEITEATRPQDWRWIPTHLNVADIATRAGYTPVDNNDLWFAGPAFLRQPRAEWPRQQEGKEDIDTAESTLVIAHQEGRHAALPEIERFSTFERLIGATAQALLFVQRCRDKTVTLGREHLERATHLWLQQAQKDSFGQDIECIKKGVPVARSSQLHSYDLVWENGLVKLNGRINKADVPEEAKKPILLDGRHALTRLLIERDHRRAGHANNERIVNNMRQRYWVLRLRPTVKKIAAACLMCRLRRQKPRSPPIGDLPPERLQPYRRPFSHCGLDYFGPVTVTIGRRREKRWVALFTCLTIRAVHLEMVASLTTDSAIMALRRMAARRGWPAVIYSDNGTNFRGADAELRKAYDEWLPQLNREAMTNEATWKYIAPGAPNQGGAWERMVRSVKTALTATLKERAPKEEILNTLLAEAEHAVNSRPLTHVSVDPNDPEALTPNHFLLGSSTGLPYTGPNEEGDRRTWRAAQALADAFWKRWLREYLPTLVPRRDPLHHRGNDIKTGDVVIIADHTLPRNTWPRGIVAKTYPGPDGVIRNVEITTKGGTFRRPASKLIVVETALSPDQRERTRGTTGTSLSTGGGCGEPSPGGDC